MQDCVGMQGSSPGAVADLEGTLALPVSDLSTFKLVWQAAAEKYRSAQEALSLKEIHAKNVSASLDRPGTAARHIHGHELLL